MPVIHARLSEQRHGPERTIVESPEATSHRLNPPVFRWPAARKAPQGDQDRLVSCAATSGFNTRHSGLCELHHVPFQTFVAPDPKVADHCPVEHAKSRVLVYNDCAGFEIA